MKLSDFLTLDETEELKDAFYAQYKRLGEVHREVWSADALPEIRQLLRDLANRIETLPVVVLRFRDDTWAAVVVPGQFALSEVPAIVRIGEEDLALTTRDTRDGLCLELKWHDDQGRHVPKGRYELRRWGLFAS